MFFVLWGAAAVAMIAAVIYLPKWPFWLSTRQANSVHDVLGTEHGADSFVYWLVIVVCGLLYAWLTYEFSRLLPAGDGFMWALVGAVPLVVVAMKLRPTRRKG